MIEAPPGGSRTLAALTSRTTARGVRCFLALALSLLLSLFAGRDLAANDAPPVPPSLGAKAQMAFELLSRADTYETEHVGEGGGLSRNAEAVRTLIREPAAPLAFQALFDHGGPVTRLYALAAFWYLRPVDFPALVELVRTQDGEREIKTRSGCIGGTQKVRALLVSNRKDRFQFKPGTRMLDALCNFHRSSFSADIAGGFAPISIVEGSTYSQKDCRQPSPRPAYLSPR